MLDPQISPAVLPPDLRRRVTTVLDEWWQWGFHVQDLPARLKKPVVNHLLGLARTVRERLQRGRSLDEIARALDTNRYTVRILMGCRQESDLIRGVKRATPSELVSLYAVEKRSLAEVAQLTGERPATVRRALIDAGARLRPTGAAGHRSRETANLKEIVRLRKSGNSLEAIGRKVGLSKEGVRQALLRAAKGTS